MKIIFVSGVMRSGTTVLQRVISHSCGAPYIRHESQLRVVGQSFETLERFDAFAPLDRSDYVAEYRALLWALFERIARKLCTDTIVVKDPLSLEVIGTFQELMPTARFVLSVRDPLATVASILRVRDKQREQGKRTFITPMHFGDIVVYVARLSERIVAAGNGPNTCIVKYEDVVCRDQAILDHLQQFISVPIQFDLDDHKDTFDQKASAFWTPEWGGPLASSALQKHRSELGEDQVELARHHLGAFSRRFGYEI